MNIDLLTVLTPKSTSLPIRQRGSVLAVALIFLVLLTLIGVAALRNSSQQQRMAGNIEQLETAFQGAETGIAAVITELINNPGELNGTNTAAKPRSFDYWIVNNTVCKKSDTNGSCNPDTKTSANAINMNLSAWFVAQSKVSAPCTSLGKGEGGSPSSNISFFAVRSIAAYGATRSDHTQGLTNYPKPDPDNGTNCKP